MDAAVTAAFVGVGGTAVVAVAGFWASARNTSKTMTEAHKSRIWDQRAAIYIEMLEGVNHRKQKREFETRTHPVDPLQSQLEQAYLATYKEPDWHVLEARLQAFASEPTYRACKASIDADRDALEKFKMWQKADEAVEVVRDASNLEVRQVCLMSLWQALGAAATADITAIGLIRAELQGGHQLPGGWQSTFGPPDPLRSN